jgi:NADH-quinone oxidoreductase subunit N
MTRRSSTDRGRQCRSSSIPMATATAAVSLLSFGYLDHRNERREEYYLLLLLAAVGSIVLVAAIHFAALLLGLELLSVSLYALDRVYPHSRAQCRGGREILRARRRLGCIPAVRDGARLRRAREDGVRMHDGDRADVADRGVAFAGVGLIVVGFGFKLALVRSTSGRRICIKERPLR